MVSKNTYIVVGKKSSKRVCNGTGKEPLIVKGQDLEESGSKQPRKPDARSSKQPKALFEYRAVSVTGVLISGH